MDQAPPAITHTINRVVEHTVEKVVPAKSQGAATVKTVIVKEESLVADAVQKNSGNIVEIFILKDTISSEDDDGNKKTELVLGEFVGLGFAISKDGMIVADSALVSNSGVYAVKTQNGTTQSISLLTQDEEKGVALLAIDIKEENKIEFSAPPLVDSDKIKLGQSVISINKKKELAVLSGIVSRLQNGHRELVVSSAGSEAGGDSVDSEDKNPEMESYLVSIHTTLNSPQSGSVLLDTDGNIMGMNISRDGISFSVPSNTIKEIIVSFQKMSESEASSPEAQG